MRKWNISLKPRKYQQDAVKYALSRQKSVCCLPTGTGKTLVGVLWLQGLMEQGIIQRALILEPTRLLVNQVDLYYRDKAGAEIQAIDGRIPPERRKILWQQPLVVATPETAYNDKDWVKYDAVIVDECHHTVGQDAFAKLMDTINYPYRLGLSATVPQKRRAEIERYIGLVRQWSWSDPEIEQYMPDWIGEVYEADLDESESQVLGLIRSMPIMGFATGLMERYLTRDGAMALAETLGKGGKFAMEFSPVIIPHMPCETNRLHKLNALQQILDAHDFCKAIVFVERRILATYLSEIFRYLHPVLFLGRGKLNQDQALERAKSPETRLIVSTSAGEEGIDLPEADLLVSWGSVASEIRFIQRHGRIMRKTEDKLKFATFIVTTATADMDSFVKGLERAQSSGQINIEESFGWEPSILWPKTTWWHVTESLRGKGGRLKTIGEALGIREQMAYNVIEGAVKRGRMFYLYDVFSMSADITRGYLKWYAGFPDIKPIAARLYTLAEKFEREPNPLALARSLANLIASCPTGIAESLVKRLIPKIRNFSPKGMIEGERSGQRRIYILSEEAEGVAEFLPNQTGPYEHFTDDLAANIITLMRRSKGKGIEKRLLSGLYVYGDTVRGDPRQFWESTIQKDWGTDTPGYTLGFRAPSLEYYFYPVSPEVFLATVSNMCGLLKWRDIVLVSLYRCSHCGSQGGWICPHCNRMLCLNCWKAEPSHGNVCWQLAEFGSPLKRWV